MTKNPNDFEVITPKAHYKVTFKQHEDVHQNVHTIQYNYPHHRNGFIVGKFDLIGHLGRTYIFQQIDKFDELIDKLFI